MAMLHMASGRFYTVEAGRIEARDFLQTDDGFGPWKSFALQGVQGMVTVHRDQVIAIEDAFEELRAVA